MITKTKLIDNRKARFSNAIWFENISKHKILLVGAGGVGSWLTIFLSRIGYDIQLVYFDTVEITNIAGQTFGIGDIGNYKVTSVHTLTRLLGCNNKLNTFNYPLNNNIIYANTDIFISAVDTIPARIELFKEFKKSIKDSIYIEARLSAEMFQIYIFTSKTITKEQEEKYYNNLNNLYDLPEDACTFKQTTHIASMIGSVITTIITNWSSNIEIGAEVKSVPNFVEFNAEFLNLNVV